MSCSSCPHVNTALCAVTDFPLLFYRIVQIIEYLKKRRNTELCCNCLHSVCLVYLLVLSLFDFAAFCICFTVLCITTQISVIKTVTLPKSVIRSRSNQLETNQLETNQQHQQRTQAHWDQHSPQAQSYWTVYAIFYEQNLRSMAMSRSWIPVFTFLSVTSCGCNSNIFRSRTRWDGKTKAQTMRPVPVADIIVFSVTTTQQVKVSRWNSSCHWNSLTSMTKPWGEHSSVYHRDGRINFQSECCWILKLRFKSCL